MKKLLKGFSIALISLFAAVGTVMAVANYSNGFEVDTDGWLGPITRVASGTNGITSATGSYHAEVAAGAFTRWGGYESTFPTNGYTTELDMYLNMAEAVGTDKRIDFSSAINMPDGNHRRDFVFSVGTKPGVPGEFVMNASNNTPGWPSNPGRDPFTISQTGWYTFRHTFVNNAGVLQVVMDVLNDQGTVLHTWTLSDPSDVIGVTVGGNRYGWFVTNQFSTLAIDNTEKNDVVVLTSPSNKEECKKDGWMTFNDPVFKNQGDCVSYVQSNEKAVGNKTK